MKTKMKKIKTVTLDQLTDKYIGKRGTPEREKFEYELKADVIGEIIKQTRLEKNLTQEQLGDLIGVQKAQISKIENNTKDVRFSTILRVFEALKATVNLSIVFDNHRKFKVA
jgi:HTH-type transcriptional regulator / antitoxin HipB